MIYVLAYWLYFLAFWQADRGALYVAALALMLGSLALVYATRRDSVQEVRHGRKPR